jgi:hypothetical protein
VTGPDESPLAAYQTPTQSVSARPPRPLKRLQAAPDSFDTKPASKGEHAGPAADTISQGFEHSRLDRQLTSVRVAHPLPGRAIVRGNPCVGGAIARVRLVQAPVRTGIQGGQRASDQCGFRIELR